MNGKNNIAVTVVVALLVGAAAFYGGMQYQISQRNSQIAGRNGGQGGFGRNGNMSGSRPVNGEIISQDDKSITIKLQDGSSKIIILSDKTAINKASAGSKSDLKTTERVTVFGTTNSDGSITAQNISIGGMFRGGTQGASPQPTK